MIERFLHRVKVERPDPGETAAGARLRLADKFPRAALRRMTHLGLLAGSVLDGTPLGPDDAVVYATTYAETRALEEYLASFPAPSPLCFQTSIHPSAVQQVLIGRQQPIARLWPLAGRTRLVEQSLLAALLEPAATVALVGGGERGTWLSEHGLAADRPFAFAALLTHLAAEAAGRISFVAGPENDEAGPTLEDFALALAERRAMGWRGADGAWEVQWS
jgi:hypothetical protein